MPVSARISSSEYDCGLRLSREGRHAEAIGCFERALHTQPDDTRVLFALGNTARALGLARPAEGFYRRVLAIEPSRLEALVNLANLLRANGDVRAAQALLAPALTRNPESPELWLTLGSVYRDMGDTVEAEGHWRQALALKSGYPAALGNLADLLADSGQHDAAFALYERALKAEPHNAQARLNRAILHLLKGNLRDGWRDYAARLKVAGKTPRCAHNLSRWTGGSLKRMRLLVTPEQGVGDQLMFASMVPELLGRATEEGGALVLECDPRLTPLFARSFPGACVRAADWKSANGGITAQYGWLKSCGGANAAIEMGSLPRWLRNDTADFPNPNAYLVADADERGRWRAQYESTGEGPFVGVCWRSGKLGGSRNLQFAPLDAWGRFLKCLPGTIVCAQYDAATEEIETLEQASGRRILAPQGIDQKQELDRACALFSALDAVVSAPTAVSWLAAGAGVPTYKILYDTSWTSFGCTFEPFAPSCQCIMPEKPGDWHSTFANALTQLRRLFASALAAIPVAA